MSNERYSYIEYVCDGSTNTFQIPFNFISNEDITVFVDGVDTAYTFTSSNTITLDEAPANEIVVRVSRTTNADTRSVDFRDGSILTEADLDTSAEQIFFVAQEAMDTARDAVTVAPDGKVDAQGRNVKSVADPTEPDHAVNLGFIQTQYSNVTAVKANQANITKVANNETNINVVSTNTANITTVSGSIVNVNSVASHIPTLNANYTKISTVANNIEDVATLSSQIDGVLQVAASFATSETQPVGQSIGDRWFEPSTGSLYIKGNDGSYYEAAIYQSVRHYQWKAIGAAKSTINGTDSNGNVLYVPPKGHTIVEVDGFTLSLSEDFTITGTSTINLLQSVAAGSSINVRVFTPVLTDEYTWFETNKNAALTSANNSNTSKVASEAAKVASEAARDAAATSRAGALSSEGLANGYKNEALTSKTAAAGSATAAAGSASAAATSASNAQASAASAARNDMDNGSVLTAGLGFVGQTNTGFYRPATSQLGVTVNGIRRSTFTTTGVDNAGITNTSGYYTSGARGHLISAGVYQSTADVGSSSTTTFYGPTMTFIPQRTSGGFIIVVCQVAFRASSTGLNTGMYFQWQYLNSSNVWTGAGEDNVFGGQWADGGTNTFYGLATPRYYWAQSATLLSPNGTYQFRLKCRGWGNNTTTLYNFDCLMSEHEA